VCGNGESLLVSLTVCVNSCFLKFIINRENYYLIINIIMTRSLKVAIIALAIVAVGAATANAAFNTNLTVGSTGADVSALQTWLISKGYSIPSISSGAAQPGYFGSQTKAAVVAYQTKNGIPSTGFFGPLTRGSVNGGGGATVVLPSSACPVGYTCTANPGTTVPATVVTGTITTPGIEGTLTVTSNNSGLASTVYENDSKVAILGFQAEAKTSDMIIERVKLDLGTTSGFYNKIFKKLYITDSSGTVLASADLNSSTVVKDGARYNITITGINSVVSRDSKKSFMVKADVYSSIDSTDYDGETYPIALAADGVRAVDGAGINQYSPSLVTTVARTPNISADLVDSATLKISTNSATPKSADVIATAGSSENELDRVTVLAFDVKAEKDAVTITDLVVDVVKTGTGGATASSTVYLFDGSTELDSASVSGGEATFSDLDYVVSKDSTKTLTVKVDIRNANGTVSQIAVDIDTADVTSENSRGDSVTESGSAIGETMHVRNVGPQFVLNSKTATRSTVSSNDTSGVATSTGTGKFSVTITAVGGDISFGTSASTTPAFSTTSTAIAAVYKNGASVGTIASQTAAGTNAIVSYSTPSSGVTTSGETWTLSEGNSVTLDVDYQITVAGNSPNSYAFQFNGVNWQSSTGTNTSTSMLNKSDWRTSTISLP